MPSPRDVLPPKPAPAADRSPGRLREINALLELAAGPTRMTILLLLDDGPRGVGAIVDGLGSPSQPAVSHQLALLSRGRLVKAERRGRHVHYALTEAGQAVTKGIRTLAESPNFR